VVVPLTYLNGKWCPSCAAIGQIAEGQTYIEMPSPGRMYEDHGEDPLSAWEDCYQKTLKKRMLKAKAKAEIQRAWDLWEDDKSRDLSMFVFFAWLQRNRPYFLSFRCKGDPWQTVHSWLLQHEGEKRSGRRTKIGRGGQLRKSA